MFSLRVFHRTTRVFTQPQLSFRRLYFKMSTFDKLTYTPAEEAEIQQWTTTANRLKGTSANGPEMLNTLNNHLATRTTTLGAKPSSADVELYKVLAPKVAEWASEQRTGQTGLPNIVRFVDFVQNAPVFGHAIPEEHKVKINVEEVLYVRPPIDAKAEKERLKKEKAAAAAAGATDEGVQKTLADRTKEAVGGTVAAAKEKFEALAKDAGAAAGVPTGANTQKKEKKAKAPKPPKAPAAIALTPSLIDLRVGHILKAINHPDADSLFVSTIAMGDKEGTDDTEIVDGQVCRTVCSGLNGLVPLEAMQDRKVVVVCNLKPVKMRGIKSSAMVLAASPRLKEGEVDNHAGPVELVTPPADSVDGQRVYFEGWKGEPEGILNPKKKVWEMIQPGFTITQDFAAAFDAGAVKELSKEGEEPKTGLGKLVTENGGFCTVKSLAGGIVR